MGFFGVDAHQKATDHVSRHGAKWLRSPRAGWFLGLISFAESVFAPILIDPFLVALIMASPEKWKRYTWIAISSSVIGGVVAYALGALFFDTLGVRLIEFYALQETFQSISNSLNNNGFVFVLIGAFTPIPYKLVALASGLLQINFFTFLVASIIGRILRLGLVGLAAHIVGPHAIEVARQHLYSIAAISGVVLVVYIVVQLLT